MVYPYSFGWCIQRILVPPTLSDRWLTFCKWIDIHVHVYMDRWMDVYMAGWMNWQDDKWLDGWMDGCMNGQHEWKDE